MRGKKSASTDPYPVGYFDRLEEFVGRVSSLKVKALSLAPHYNVVVIVYDEDTEPEFAADPVITLANHEGVVLRVGDEGEVVDFSSLFHAMAIKGEEFRIDYGQFKVLGRKPVCLSAPGGRPSASHWEML